jgi:hypothetical protein
MDFLLRAGSCKQYLGWALQHRRRKAKDFEMNELFDESSVLRDFPCLHACLTRKASHQKFCSL